MCSKDPQDHSPQPPEESDSFHFIFVVFGDTSSSSSQCFFIENGCWSCICKWYKFWNPSHKCSKSYSLHSGLLWEAIQPTKAHIICHILHDHALSFVFCVKTTCNANFCFFATQILVISDKLTRVLLNVVIRHFLWVLVASSRHFQQVNNFNSLLNKTQETLFTIHFDR